MSKYRFTDSEKWRDSWFMDLPSKYKLLWIYMTDECDIAGIWKVNFKVAQFYVGDHLEVGEVKRVFSERMKFISDEYWWVKGFVKFQQRVEIDELNPSNKCHLGIIKRLSDFQLVEPLNTSPLQGANKGLTSPTGNSNSKSKGNSNSLEGGAGGRFYKPKPEEILAYCEEKFCDTLERKTIEEIPEEFIDYWESVGWIMGHSKKKMANWKNAVNTWVKNILKKQAKENNGTKSRTQQNIDIFERTAKEVFNSK